MNEALISYLSDAVAGLELLAQIGLPVSVLAFLLGGCSEDKYFFLSLVFSFILALLPSEATILALAK